MTSLAFVLVVLASALMGVAAIAQAVAARRVSGPAVVVHPWYLTGGALDVIGWALSLVAMRALPLLVVQTVLAASLGITVVLARVLLRVKVSRAGAAAVVVMSVAVTVVSLAGQPGPAGAPPGWFAQALWVALILSALVAVVAYRRPRVVPLAILAGVGYAGSAIGARGLEFTAWQQLALNPVSWAIVGFALVGTFMFSRALQASPDAVAPATAWLWLMEIVLPAAVGLGVLGDRVRPGWGLAALAFTGVAVGAALVLSRSVSMEEPG